MKTWSLKHRRYILGYEMADESTVGQEHKLHCSQCRSLAFPKHVQLVNGQITNCYATVCFSLPFLFLPSPASYF